MWFKLKFSKVDAIKLTTYSFLLFHRIAKSIDVALQLSETYSFQVFELGHAMVLCLFSIIVHLIDSTLDDLGLQMGSKGGACEVNKSEDTQRMDIDFRENQVHKTNEFHELIRRTNSFMCLEVLIKLTENKRVVGLLRLVHLNMYVQLLC